MHQRRKVVSRIEIMLKLSGSMIYASDVSGATVARKREVVLRLLRDEPVQLLSRQLGVEIFRLEQWREKAIGGIDASLKQRKGDPVQAELDSAMKRIGELTMQVELLEAKTETFGPLGRRRSRR